MKLAVSGAHQTGKTTLIDELIACRPTFARIDEPYYLLEDEGYAFADTPGVEDFERQLERSLRSIAESEGDCIFDRCPLDLLAYLVTLDESDAFDLDRRLPAVRESMRPLDLIVFVPIEVPDLVVATEHVDLRRRVDAELQSIVLDDCWDCGVPAIQVTGSPRQRARQVLKHLETAYGSR